MTSAGDATEPPPKPAGVFATTHWSVVLAAGQQESAEAHAALEQLCRAYWYPLYAFVRRRGHEREEAEDLTQEFFVRFLSRNYLAGVDRAKGRFRSYLLGAMNHFLADTWDAAHRIKRGGHAPHVPFEVEAGEDRYGLATSHQLSPDRLYERCWALALLEQVLQGLFQEYRNSGKEPLFERLSGFLTGDREEESYGEAAADLGMTEGAVRVAVHRLRKRYAEVLVREVARTVSRPEEVQEELYSLFRAIDR